MKLAKLLFKPKWQDKDAAVRRAAITAGTGDAELLAALPEIARRDEDSGVRLAALQRLADYEAWRERSTGDVDANVRNTAREIYLTMFCSGAARVPSIARRIAELETLSEDEIERVASTAAEVVLRREAISRVVKQTLLAQRSAADPDASLRLELVERVTDATLLERIAERTRKTDKAVSRRARERLQASAIATGDTFAIAERARTLCERSEAIMRAPAAGARELLQAIESEWAALANAAPAPLAARFHGAYALALKAIEPRPATPEIQTPVEPPTPMPEPLVQPLPPKLDNRADEQLRAERIRQKNLRQQFEQKLSELAAALDAGDASDAHQLHAALEEMLARPEANRDLRAQLERLQPRYAELKRWQHWSNNQRRRTLCTEIEAMIDSGAHPDAVATRVRETREEWQKLNANEGAADSEAAAGLSHRFHALCARALRPTRAYFAKRKEVRQTHAQEIDALLARAGAIADDSSDWKAIAETQTQASAALRVLDGVEPRQRTQLARQLKDVIARMAALASAHERSVEVAKAQLIAQATVLSGSTGASAARDARELQQRWTALGNGRRSTDQKQWREFRAACDAVFGNLDAARKERVAAEKTEREQVEQAAAQAARKKAEARTRRLSRFTDLLQAERPAAADEPGDEDIARDLLVQIEFLAGVPTPQDDRQRRMAFQMRRLATHLRERSSITAEAELERLLRDWNAQPPQRDDLEQRFAAAAKAAIDSLP